MTNQEIIEIKASELLSTVQDLKTDGWRIGQACATKVDGGVDILYCFDKDHVLKNFKLHVADNEVIQSITNIYWAAFIYENEMQDLFGVEFKNMALNYGGHFFKVAEPTPWNPGSELGKKLAEEKEAEKIEQVKKDAATVAEEIEAVQEAAKEVEKAAAEVEEAQIETEKRAMEVEAAAKEIEESQAAKEEKKEEEVKEDE